MKIHHTMAFVLLLLLPALFAGCGSDTAQTSTTLVASQQCIGCHASNSKSISPVTGERITDEWQRSAHNTPNGARCPDCHTNNHFHADFTDCLACHSSHNHPDSCGQCHGGSTKITNCRDCHDVASQLNASLTNPDAAGKCLDCHSTLGAPHFSNNISGITHDAQFVDLQNEGKCRNCHNPHDTTILPEARDWAKSGHGDVKAKPWAEEDLKSMTSCLRCHTATGFVNYVTSTPTFTLPTAPLAASGTYGVLGCNTCHTSYAFKQSVRQVAQYTAPYNNGLSPKTFPDVGATNLCIPCHSGRESENTIKAIADFTDVGFKNSHYMAAAGLMYMTTGFTNFTSANTPIGTTTYGKSLTIDNITDPLNGVAGGVNSAHRRLGTPLINGDSHNLPFFVAGNADSGGPCVTCHLNAITRAGTTRPGTHTLAISSEAFEQICTKCHPSEEGTPLTGANFKTAFLEPQSEVFRNALTLAIALLQSPKYNIKYDPATHPYFYDLTTDPTGKTPVRDWTRGTQDQKFGQRIMGACYNINLLNRDPAAYAHGRTFTRRLIYDTIDFLDDGKINLTSGATALAQSQTQGSLVYGLYGKGSQAFTDGTLTELSPGTTESMVYLIGWTRGTGTWNTPERP
jgi:formate-dependent nitrite reductase cytochrome c552 subunit